MSFEGCECECDCDGNADSYRSSFTYSPPWSPRQRRNTYEDNGVLHESASVALPDSDDKGDIVVEEVDGTVPQTSNVGPVPQTSVTGWNPAFSFASQGRGLRILRTGRIYGLILSTGHEAIPAPEGRMLHAGQGLRHKLMNLRSCLIRRGAQVAPQTTDGCSRLFDLAGLHGINPTKKAKQYSELVFKLICPSSSLPILTHAQQQISPWTPTPKPPLILPTKALYHIHITFQKAITTSKIVPICSHTTWYSV